MGEPTHRKLIEFQFAAPDGGATFSCSGKLPKLMTPPDGAAIPLWRGEK